MDRMYGNSTFLNQRKVDIFPRIKSFLVMNTEVYSGS